MLLAACLSACSLRVPINALGAANAAGEDPDATVKPVLVVEPAALSTASPSSTSVPTASDAPSEETPQNTPVLTPNISVTTGRMLALERRYQPVLAVIGNEPKVRPQTGLMQADIIYEISLDRTDHGTRLLALFSDQDPVRTGPIRDARFPFFDLQREWNAMMVYDGYPADPGYPMFDQTTISIPAAYTEATAPYFVSDKTVTSEPVNTQFCKLSEMRDALYGQTSVTSAGTRFLFKAGVIPANSKPFDKVGIPFTSSDFAKAEFVYHADDNMLYRLERNSKGTLVQTKTLTPSADGATLASEPLRVQNLIIQYVKYEDMVGGIYRNASLVSNGKCDYFINGRYAAGLWSRAGISEPTIYVLRDGTPLTLEPGTTWIAFQSLQRDAKVHLA